MYSLFFISEIAVKWTISWSARDFLEKRISLWLSQSLNGIISEPRMIILRSSIRVVEIEIWSVIMLGFQWLGCWHVIKAHRCTRVGQDCLRVSLIRKMISISHITWNRASEGTKILGISHGSCERFITIIRLNNISSPGIQVIGFRPVAHI